MGKTRSSVLDLARGEMSGQEREAIRDVCIRMTRAAERGVPPSVRSVMYAISQAEPRRSHILGRFPDVAFACAMEGAPLNDVIAPLREMEAILRTRFYRRALPTLEEAQQMETRAEYELNRIQIILDRHSPRHIIANARDAAVEHRSALETLLEVLDATYHAPVARLVA